MCRTKQYNLAAAAEQNVGPQKKRDLTRTDEAV
jgi:hypothetical protein